MKIEMWLHVKVEHKNKTSSNILLCQNLIKTSPLVTIGLLIYNFATFNSYLPISIYFFCYYLSILRFFFFRYRRCNSIYNQTGKTGTVFRGFFSFFWEDIVCTKWRSSTMMHYKIVMRYWQTSFYWRKDEANFQQHRGMRCLL